VIPIVFGTWRACDNPNRSLKPQLYDAIFAVFQKLAAENAPVKRGVTRREQDALGVLSYTRAGPGIADGTLTGEISGEYGDDRRAVNTLAPIRTDAAS
jgi:acetyl-CoA acetyltransferase